MVCDKRHSNSKQPSGIRGAQAFAGNLVMSHS